MQPGTLTYDAVIIGGGAAGLFCAIEAGKRGRSVAVIEHSPAVGSKIRISGGGRCNFTNLHTGPRSFLSDNPHFCKSALARYTPGDFIALIERYGIRYHEKTLGQLFCDESARQIIDMLLAECRAAGVTIRTGCRVTDVRKDNHFTVDTTAGPCEASSLVIATGGISVPKSGATDFGYRLARRFGLTLTDIRPGLVPLLWNPDDLELFGPLSGVSLHALARCGPAAFEEDILFTHRGLSGPAILQVSSYWRKGDEISLDLDPSRLIEAYLIAERTRPVSLASALANFLPKRFVQQWSGPLAETARLSQLSNARLEAVIAMLHRWTVTPDGTEGFPKAEVTVGGISTDELSSKTMEAHRIPGLFCIGEVVDVTGHLGGYNFQWAWSSGFAAGQYV